jgi:hypothetical protein
MKAARRTTLIGAMCFCAISATTAVAEPAWTAAFRHCQLPAYSGDFASLFYVHVPPRTRQEKAELTVIIDMRKDTLAGRSVKVSNVAELTPYNQAELKSYCSLIERRTKR